MFPPDVSLLLFEFLQRFPPRPVTAYYQIQRQAWAEISCNTKSNSASEVSSSLSIFQTQWVLVGASARQLTAIRNVGLRAHETIKLNSIQNEPGE